MQHVENKADIMQQNEEAVPTVNNDNNINELNNNNSFRDKDDEELSQSSGESGRSNSSAKRFLKNRLLIYDDIIITYNRITNDEKSLLNEQQLSVESFLSLNNNTHVGETSLLKTSSDSTDSCNDRVSDSKNF
jgi:hypothetical protein